MKIKLTKSDLKDDGIFFAYFCLEFFVIIQLKANHHRVTEITEEKLKANRLYTKAKMVFGFHLDFPFFTRKGLMKNL